MRTEDNSLCFKLRGRITKQVELIYKIAYWKKR